MSASTNLSDGSTEIPQTLESVEAIEFLGFTPEAASEIYQRFLDGKSVIPDDEIINYAKGHVRSAIDSSAESDDWDKTMIGMGIAPDLRRQILDPDFAEIRRTCNAAFWVLDTIVTLYNFFADKIHNLGTSNEPVKIDTRSQYQLSSPSKAAASSSSPSKQGRRGSKQASETPRPEIATGTADRDVKPGEVDLMKGGAFDRLEAAIKLPTDEQPVNRIGNVLSRPPSDFSGDEQMLYFSKQRQTAYRFADYARTRLRKPGDPVAVGILHVIVPRDILANSVEVHGTKWKEFVW